MSTALAEPTADLARAQELRDQADKMERTKLELSRRARELEEQIIELRVQADRIERPAISRFAGAIGKQLDAIERAMFHGANTAPQIAEHTGLSYARVRSLLDQMEERGLVIRYGVKRGTRYVLPSDEAHQTPDIVREFGNYETVVRDAILRLDTFDFPMLVAELPSMSEHTVRRWLNVFEQRGMVTSERDGVRKMYAVVEVTGSTPARRRHTPPEVEARAMVAPERRRGSVVVGTGRTTAPGKVVSELLREVRRIGGVEVVQTAHAYTFRKDGKVIGSCSRTPGASALGGTRKQLRDAGVMVKP